MCDSLSTAAAAALDSVYLSVASYTSNNFPTNENCMRAELLFLAAVHCKNKIMTTTMILVCLELYTFQLRKLRKSRRDTTMRLV